jgi:hypothetical protein
LNANQGAGLYSIYISNTLDLATDWFIHFARLLGISSSATPKPVKKSTPTRRSKKECSLRFEPVAIDSMISVLDAASWVDGATAKTISQFSDVDPRTVGKVVKNCLTLELLEVVGEALSLRLPYPPKGTTEEKKTVLREAFVKMPLMVQMRQFLTLGDKQATALRKAATMIGVENYDENSLTPLLKWARDLGALDTTTSLETLVEAAVTSKELRHTTADAKVVAFLSHSSADKPFVRKLSADLVAAGIDVWLDEQTIFVGDSITEKIGQGLAQSDFFVILLSDKSVQSEWVRKELNRAIVQEVENRRVTVLPVRLSSCEVPEMLKDKKYADFRTSYKDGLRDLINTMKVVKPRT